MEQYYEHGCSKGRLRYKSKDEEQLALLFDREGISYNYEHALAVIDRGKAKVWYPDFWLRDFGMIVEYFGVNGKQDYDSQAKHKMEVYRQNGIEGLFLTKSCFKGDWPVRITSQIEDILKGRMDRFYNRHKFRDLRCNYSHGYDK
jgi:hypothetical protein